MERLGSLGYGAASAAFLFLLILVLANRESHKQRGLLTLTALVTMLWAALLAYDAFGGQQSLRVLLISDFIRSGFWIILLLGVLSANRMALLQNRLVVACFIVAVVSLFYTLFSGSLIGVLLEHAQISIVVGLGFLALAFAGIFLLEQLYRNAEPAKRWGLKFLCSGLGLMFAFDLYLYSMVVLYRYLDPVAWYARGVICVFAVPLLMIAIRRNPDWSLNIFVSRQAVVYSASLMGVGIYLTAMALGGYYIRLYGGSWGGAAQIIFLFGSGLGLLLLLFSGSLRAQLRVFVGKHFYHNKYDYRELWLRFTKVLAETDTTEMPNEDRILMAAGETIDSQAGALWVREKDSDFLVFGNWNLPMEAHWQIQGESNLAVYFSQKDWVIDTLELKENPELYEGLELPEWFSDMTSGESLVLPLYSDGALIGIMMLVRPQHFELTWEDTDLLKTVAQQAASHIVQALIQRRLAENRQFEAYNRLVSFMMHDLKNLIAQQVLVVNNAARHKDNPEFVDDMISTVENSVKRMNNLLAQLRPEQSGQVKAVAEVGEVVEAAINTVSSGFPKPRLVAVENARVEVDPAKLSMIVCHILKNAQEATPRDGEIDVKVFDENGKVAIEVRDTGTGMDLSFQKNRLFQPFYSTKGSKGMGIGAYQVREFAREAGGDVKVVSSPEMGTSFTLLLPVVNEDPTTNSLAS